MVIFNKKKGQAAIEFLMTYGWMLLVVLIVGALIFSFVDFGNLLPNSVTINSPSIQPVVADSFAVDNVAPAGSGNVLIAFKYNGVKPAEFEILHDGSHGVEYNFGADSCNTTAIISNKDAGTVRSGLNEKVRFRTGQSGYILFENCTNFNQIGVVEGALKLTFESTSTGATVPVYGNVRFAK